MRGIDVASGRPVVVRLWDGVAWRVAPGFDASATREPTVTPPKGPVKNIVAGGALMNSAVNNTGRVGSMVAARMKVLVDAISPVAEFDVLMSTGVAEVVELQAAVSVDDGEPEPVTFGGDTTARLRRPGTSGGIVHVKTDPLPVVTRAGQTLNFWGFSRAPEGGTAQGDSVGYTPGVDAWYSQGGTFEEAWNATHQESTDMGLGVYPAARPARVVAPSDKPSWLLSGDSIMHWSRSHAQRWAIKAGVAWAKNATGGRNYIHATREYNTLYSPSARSATLCLEGLGINGANFELGLEHWRRLRGDGIEGIVKPTLTPQTQSRDGWRTVEGQVAVSDVEGFLRWDAWLLDGAPMRRDWSTVVDPGSQGADVVRCAVVDSAGKLVRTGEPGHVFGTGGVVDWNPVVSCAGMSPAGSRRVWRTDIGLSSADYGDGLHPGDGVHEVMAEYLVKAMPVVLGEEAHAGRADTAA